MAHCIYSSTKNRLRNSGRWPTAALKPFGIASPYWASECLAQRQPGHVRNGIILAATALAAAGTGSASYRAGQSLCATILQPMPPRYAAKHFDLYLRVEFEFARHLLREYCISNCVSKSLSSCFSPPVCLFDPCANISTLFLSALDRHRLERIACHFRHNNANSNHSVHYFLRAAYRKGAVAAKFGLLPGAFLYEHTQHGAGSDRDPVGCSHGQHPFAKRAEGSPLAFRKPCANTGNIFNLHEQKASAIGSSKRSIHTAPARSKQNGAGHGGPPAGVIKERRCEHCGFDGHLPAAHTSGLNVSPLQSDGDQRRIAAPMAQKALPEPPLDPLYFYHHATRQEILREISGFFPRLRARLRRALKGSYQKRPWTVDDIFALATWIVMSQAMLLLIGTTTTVSVVLWLLNRLQYQDWIARKLGDWVSSALGITVSFESAIVPAWGRGTIRLKNVRIHCGPEHGALMADGSRDTNFTTYELHVDQVDVALSLWRWMDDRGVIRECSMRGVRGVVDRRQVWWDPDALYVPGEFRRARQPGYFDMDALEVEDMLLTVHPWQNFRPITVSIYSASLPRFRDRWLLYDALNANSIVGMYDGSLFTIHQAHQHLLARPQQLSGTDPGSSLRSATVQAGSARTAHVQIENLNIDHINSGVEGPVGWITSGRLNVSALVSFPPQPSGTDPAMAIRKIVDNINDSIDVVILPSMPDWSNPERSPNPVVRGLYHLDMVDSPLALEMHKRLRRHAERESQRRLEKQRQRTASWSQPLAPIPTHQIGGIPRSAAASHAGDYSGPGTAQPAAQLMRTLEDPTAVHVDLQVEFNDIRASVPLTTPQLGHPLLSSVLVRPIVAYMNAHRTSLPMRCQLRLRPDDFDGAWSFWDSGADALISQGIGAAFTQLAHNERERNRRLKLVGWWSITAIVRQLVRLVDFVNGQRGFFYYLGTTPESDRI